MHKLLIMNQCMFSPRTHNAEPNATRSYRTQH